ncbi:MAG TPA: DUF2283 domain-containing protein [Candidatus Methylomirabilis sp.]|jgi:hypothetical protein|nr:DUF2283 domain-containing protein [Candidatus Methylomirabilis sp.]
MRLRYDPAHDVLLIRDGEGAIDYAEEMGAFLVHCTAEGRPVLLELFGAGEFLRHAGRLIEGGEDEPGGTGPQANHPGGG